MRYDDIVQKDLIFNMPPIEFEDISEQSDSSVNDQDSYDTRINHQKIEFEKFNKSYKGWKLLSGIILSKNTQKINFLKNWRTIYDNTHKKGKNKL